MKCKKSYILTLVCSIFVFNCGCGGTEKKTINTPVTLLDEEWKFAVISDTQGPKKLAAGKYCINREVLDLIAADIAAEMPDFVLVSGDLVNGWMRNEGMDYAAQYSDWKNVMGQVYDLGIRVFALRGNHDSGPERLVTRQLFNEPEPAAESLELLKNEYRAAVIGSYIPMNGPEKEKSFTYSFTHKNVRIIALDQYTDGEHKINQEWLDLQLAGNKSTHLFIFSHEPAFDLDYRDNMSFYPEKRDRFWDSISAAGARIFFCGHDHYYNRALIEDSSGNSVWQIIAGTGGGELQKWSGRYRGNGSMMCEFHSEEYHGYVIVTVRGPDVRVEWKAITDLEAGTWHVLDSFEYKARP